jgi:hypothetical protein
MKCEFVFIEIALSETHDCYCDVYSYNWSWKKVKKRKNRKKYRNEQMEWSGVEAEMGIEPM